MAAGVAGAPQTDAAATIADTGGCQLQRQSGPEGSAAAVPSTVPADQHVGRLRPSLADHRPPAGEQLSGRRHQIVERGGDLASLEAGKPDGHVIAPAVENGVTLGTMGPGGHEPLQADPRPGQGGDERRQLRHLTEVSWPGERPLHQQVAGIATSRADRVDVVPPGPFGASKAGGRVQLGGDGALPSIDRLRHA